MWDVQSVMDRARRALDAEVALASHLTVRDAVNVLQGYVKRRVDPVTTALWARTPFPVMRQEAKEAFGWLDRPTAFLRLSQMRRAGRITREEHESLRHWSRSGYLVLERAIEPHLIDAALRDVDDAWKQRRHVPIDVLTTGERTFLDEVSPETRQVPHKLNDLYHLSAAALSLFLHPRIVRLCELILDDVVVGCNTLTFERGSAQPAHVDHVYMTPPKPRRLVASWIALEDVNVNAGPLLLWAGSHHLAPFDFGSTRYHYTPELESKNTAYLADQKGRFAKTQFRAKKGDVLLWHSMLIHGGDAINDLSLTRKSMACHYFARSCYEQSALSSLGTHERAFYQQKI